MSIRLIISILAFVIALPVFSDETADDENDCIEIIQGEECQNARQDLFSRYEQMRRDCADFRNCRKRCVATKKECKGNARVTKQQCMNSVDRAFDTCMNGCSGSNQSACKRQCRQQKRADKRDCRSDKKAAKVACRAEKSRCIADCRDSLSQDQCIAARNQFWNSVAGTAQGCGVRIAAECQDVFPQSNENGGGNDGANNENSSKDR